MKASRMGNDRGRPLDALGVDLLAEGCKRAAAARPGPSGPGPSSPGLASPGAERAKVQKPCVLDPKRLENLFASSVYGTYAKHCLVNEILIMYTRDKEVLYAQLAELATLSMKDLRRLWQEKIGTVPRENAKRQTLIEDIARRLQENALGVLSPSAKERLAIYAERCRKGHPLLGEGTRYSLVPGMILTRIYNGKSHSVKILEGLKVEYNGQVYGSLSAVAGAITGTKWNGLRFFHCDRRSA